MIYKLVVFILNLSYKYTPKLYNHFSYYVAKYAWRFLTIEELVKVLQHRTYGGKL